MKAFLYALLPSFSAPTIITTNIFFCMGFPRPQIYFMLSIAWGHGLVLIPA